MANEERETPQARTQRLLSVAIGYLQAVASGKREGDYGETSVALVWKNGQIESIRTGDESSWR